MTTLYLIPSLLHEEGMSAIPPALTESIKNCEVFFVENERTTRRFFKKLWKSCRPGEEIIIDDYEWHTIDDKSPQIFRQLLKAGKTIGIVSEAGCPGIADPGQSLIAIAQEMNIRVKPLVGPNSILLALMASGMNGQQFHFAGYLPIDPQQRSTSIKELESESRRKNSTQIFIETPYRNNQMMEAILKTCQPGTQVCISVDLTAPTESIQTKKVADWQQAIPDLHKRPVIFLLYAGT